LAIDLQNEQGVSHTSFPLGWICDIATHLKDQFGLQGTAVATRAIGSSDSGNSLPATSSPNWPDEVFHCPAMDIIYIYVATFPNQRLKMRVSCGGAFSMQMEF
jgi:hypothetical protein